MNILEELGFFTLAASGQTLVEKKENQITFENFIVQAENKGILQYKKNCLKDLNGKGMAKLPNIVSRSMYNLLYDCLIDVNIIIKKVTFGSFFVFGRSYIINKTMKLSTDNIKNLLDKKNNSDYIEIKKCFDINFDKLSKLLENYKYNATDQFSGGKNKKNNKTVKNRTTRKRQNHI